jgi:hypothetical protein
MNNSLLAVALTAVFAFSNAAGGAAAPPAVTATRVPDGGIQPQLAVDGTGAIHLIYFGGDLKAGDVFYTRSSDAGRTFTPAIRVNSQPGSVLAGGTVRGPQIAVGRGDRPHVVWMGSATAAPRAPDAKGRAPLLYARLDDAGKAFEPQRNLITAHAGLDGGLSVAADRKSGDVYAVWHAPEQGKEGEAERRVWVARSADDGKTFGPEAAANPDPTGLCGCCGMRAFCGRDGTLYVAYRSASEVVNRDTYLLTSRDHGKTFASAKLDPMKMGACIMSTVMLAERPAGAGDGGVLVAWETSGRVFFAPIDPAGRAPVRPIPAPGKAAPSKHPALASNAAGQMLVAWTEGTGWQKGGTLAWQVYDRDGRPVADAAGRAPNLPATSLPAAFAKPDGGFVVLY